MEFVDDLDAVINGILRIGNAYCTPNLGQTCMTTQNNLNADD